METRDASRRLYSRIQPYQTRIIKLYGAEVDAPLVCKLYGADILHSKFDGIGLRARSGADDRIVRYDALSYTWGSGSTTQVITCNGVTFPITDNLFQALRALRDGNKGVRYIWVDALCINQSDDLEKAQQVGNMLEIYQKARTVVAWLGPASPDVRNALISIAAAQRRNDVELFPPGESARPYLKSIYDGVSELYQNPWFRRIWVQQEIFAARKLKLTCGDYTFLWSHFLSDPRALEERLIKEIKEKVAEDFEITHAEIAEQGLHVAELHRQLLYNFERFQRFAILGSRKLDLIDILLDTSILEASKPCDYIYGLLGISGIPAKSMSIASWQYERSRSLFIPVDYSADLISVLSTVTWYALMQGGLSILTKFKIFHSGYELDDFHEKQSLPSWVIDWRLSASIMKRTKAWNSVYWGTARPELSTLNLVNSFRYTRATLHPLEMTKSSWNQQSRFALRNVPAEHRLFQKANSGANTGCTELVLQGVVDPRYFIEDGTLFEKKGRLLKDRVVARVKYLIPSDLVVYIFGLGDMGPDMATNRPRRFVEEGGGVWILRPAPDNRFKLIRFVSFVDDGDFPLMSYDHRGDCRPLVKKGRIDPSEDSHIRLFLRAETDGSNSPVSLTEAGMSEIREFIIV